VRPALIVFAVAFLLAGAILSVVGGRSITEEWRFARSGVSTDGMILAKEINRSRRGLGRSYEATYRFMVPEGVFESRSRLSYDSWMRLKQGQAAEVLYLPEQPATNRLAGPRQWMGAALTALVGGALFAIGATFLYRRPIACHPVNPVRRA
jgi:hypothetical protein